ncbi:alpha/beta hydrolase [Flagellimonas hymeniacidonis]|uniref:Alpha/beta hydrolase n=1 Tax=Flagellimonas hymeniacidonis TaxID=2603628 RepID=A0A5C8V1J4_9FLAO|nr:alpha/beta hydrolase [Flagellimonas hymeniacidonis]TXN35019.1 alpha/beta hydrolase [Flagellimonas hymeniacidonis]
MLHYTIYRHDVSEDWVTFVHGAGGSSTIWYKQLRDFKKNFNILLLDLRGHGNSKPHIKDVFSEKYTFDSITDDIVEVLDHEHIESSHFIGISLGTILIRNLAENYSDRVKSMVMGGAIMKLNLRSQVLMRLGIVFKSIVPYLWLYKFFAFVIMPNKNHKESRLLFVREAKKLYQKEFIRWFKLTSEINPLLRFFRAVDIKIPTYYIMGGEDYLFLPTIKKVSNTHTESTLYVIENCGHVVNVEAPSVFNEKVIDYLQNLK